MRLNQEHLNGAVCAAPGCTHEKDAPLFLHGKCHPSEGTRVSYHPSKGCLEVRCRRCEKLIAEIEVAP